MRVVAQRVTVGSVSWESAGTEHRATIGRGFVLLVGAAGDDDSNAVRRLADKIIDLRVFADEAGKMNLSLVDVGGAALIVSQFTLFADMSKGRRPSLLKAGDPARAEQLYEACRHRERWSRHVGALDRRMDDACLIRDIACFRTRHSSGSP